MGCADGSARDLHARCAPQWSHIWDEFMAGHLDERGLWEQRMVLVYAEAGVAANESTRMAARDRYVQAMEDALVAYADVVPALEAAQSTGACLAVLTNGVLSLQEARLRRLGLWGRFDFVLISGALGFGKPDARFFAEALRRACVPAQRAVMIGDNPTADIAGAKSCGMHAIWVNRRNVMWPFGHITPDATVTDLTAAVAAAHGLLR